MYIAKTLKKKRDDAWQENDERSREKDVIDTIVDKIVSMIPRSK